MDRCRDLLGVRLQREVAGVEEADNCTRNVALESLRAGGRKNGSFLPHTARNGGLWVRKYYWKVG